HEKLATEIWRPLGYQESEQGPGCRTCQHLRVVARIRSDVSLGQAAVELNAVFANVRRDHPSDYDSGGVMAQPLHEQFSGDSKTLLLTLFGAVACVLLVACANVAGLMLSRSVTRRREIALRAALGAGRARIVRQLLTESLLFAFTGGALGIFVAYAGIRGLIAIAPTGIPRLEQVSLNGITLGFAAGVSILTGVLFGLVPALSASRLDLADAMKEGGRGASGARRAGMREVLVLADVAVALVLLAGAGLMMRSLANLLDVNPGFAPHRVLTMQLSLFGPQFNGNDRNEKVNAAFAQMLERVRALPGVQVAGAVTQLPLGGDGDMYGMLFKDKPVANPADSPSADRYCVTPGYIEAMGIRVLRGRSITEEDRASAEPVILVNETIARKIWPGEDPLGKFVQMGGSKTPWRRVVGVTGRVTHTGLDEPERMQFYAPEVQWHFTDSGLTLAVKTASDPAHLASAIRETVWSVNRNTRIERVATMEDVVSSSASSRRFAMLLLSLFAGVAVLLAGIGLYGLMAFTVAQRTAEIGIRMALGASPGNMLASVMGRGMKLVLTGVAIGLFAALTLSRLMEGLLFEVKASDPLTLGTVAMVMCVVAMAACWIPARRAARVDPLVALRYE
ncbi:MAG: ABC transporter permease, partial [Acidobacteria bacterium]|nr:ABC transporter permease [Acidobacteriota bacterium]